MIFPPIHARHESNHEEAPDKANLTDILQNHQLLFKTTAVLRNTDRRRKHSRLKKTKKTTTKLSIQDRKKEKFSFIIKAITDIFGKSK